MSSFVLESNSGASLLRAKNIDYTPDITSDSYWDSHYIGIARITRMGRDAAGDFVTYTVTRVLSNGGMLTDRTVHTSAFWFGADVDEPVQLVENQQVVLYEAKHEPAPIVVSLADNNSEEVAALLHISRLRMESGPTPAVMESVFDQSNLISLYSLRRLREAPSVRAPDGYVARLVQLRNQESRPAQSRILAARIVDKLDGRRDGSDIEYEWLKRAIPQASTADWTHAKPFFDRIVEFERKREETVSVLTGVVKRPDAPQALRIAAYSTFDDLRLFHFDAPDAPSDLIFATCVQMLNDRDPVIRPAGAALLHNIAVRVAPRYRPKYVQEAKRAIEAARDRESDPTARFQLGHFLGLLERAPMP